MTDYEVWTGVPGRFFEFLGIKIIVGIATGDYQGDFFLAVHDDEYPSKGYGLAIVGYGSCSGCDAYQAAESPSERLDVIKSWIENITWFETFTELQAHVTEKNDKLDWYGHEKAWPEFQRRVAAANEHDRQTEDSR